MSNCVETTINRTRAGAVQPFSRDGFNTVTERCVLDPLDPQATWGGSPVNVCGQMAGFGDSGYASTCVESLATSQLTVTDDVRRRLTRSGVSPLPPRLRDFSTTGAQRGALVQSDEGPEMQICCRRFHEDAGSSLGPPTGLADSESDSFAADTGTTRAFCLPRPCLLVPDVADQLVFRPSSPESVFRSECLPRPNDRQNPLPVDVRGGMVDRGDFSGNVCSRAPTVLVVPEVVRLRQRVEALERTISDFGRGGFKDRHTSRSLMMPDKFDGSSCFRSFLAAFENCCRYNDWDEDDRLAYLRHSLTGEAAQVLWLYESSSYADLVDRLELRYGTTGMEELFRAELPRRRRQPGEAIRDLAHDIRRMMVLSYADHQTALFEKLATDFFLTALDDRIIELKVREREPVDMDAAVLMAQRYEVLRQAIKNRQSQIHHVGEVDDHSGDDMHHRGTEQRRCELQRPAALVENFREALVNLRMDSQRASDVRVEGSASRPTTRSTHRRGFRRRGACFRCGLIGHLARNCSAEGYDVSSGGRLSSADDAGYADERRGDNFIGGPADETHSADHVSGSRCFADRGSTTKLKLAGRLEVPRIQEMTFHRNSAKGATTGLEPRRGVASCGSNDDRSRPLESDYRCDDCGRLGAGQSSGEQHSTCGTWSRRRGSHR